LGEDLGVGRNDNDGTRNADKPSSEFHISSHLEFFIGPRIWIFAFFRLSCKTEARCGRLP
jgi:hypothetical protein